jgi:RNA polymerase sigma-70 factor (ECF subfamily)
MEQDIFQAIYNQFYPVVFRLCLGYFKGDREFAADMVQEVFMRIWEKHDEFRNESQVNTWIYRIAVNCCLTEIRRKKSYETRIQTYRQPEGDSSEKQQQDQEILHQCIVQLDEPDRLLAMLVLEDLSHQEIAKVLGLTEVNTRVKVHRLKEKLRKNYETITTNVQ